MTETGQLSFPPLALIIRLIGVGSRLKKRPQRRKLPAADRERDRGGVARVRRRRIRAVCELRRRTKTGRQKGRRHADAHALCEHSAWAGRGRQQVAREKWRLQGWGAYEESDRGFFGKGPLQHNDKRGAAEARHRALLASSTLCGGATGESSSSGSSWGRTGGGGRLTVVVDCGQHPAWCQAHRRGQRWYSVRSDFRSWIFPHRGPGVRGPSRRC